jgi:predicted nucleic acid-binding protein
MATLKSGNNYLFDTSVYIDLLRGRKAGIRLHYEARFNQVSVGYSIITEAELWQGIIGLRTEEQHIIALKPYKRYRVNVTIARNAGTYWKVFYFQDKLRNKDLPALPDCLIAATARFYGLYLVSKNTRHASKFKQFGVLVEEYSDED